MSSPHSLFLSFFFNDTATTEIYTLSLHDALPIYRGADAADERGRASLPRRKWIQHERDERRDVSASFEGDRKSTRLNSSHVKISYAVFCLKKKKKKIKN